jgi:GDP-L-fucose synthase
MKASSKIVVTGGSGFLGSRLVAQLRAQGYEDVFVVRKSAYDLTEQKEVRRLMQDIRPQVVFHLAAIVGGIGANRDNPGKFFYENAVMGVMLLEECRRANVEKVIITGTICSYPKFAEVPFKEDHLWQGYPEETNAPYGLAKKMLLVQSQAYRQQYGFNSIFLMPVNLYGPGDHFEESSSHVIPAMIRKFLEAKESGKSSVTLWGDGTPTREFLYVDDAARAIVLAAQKYDGDRPVNLGSGLEISISDLADLIAKAVGYQGEIIWDKSKPNGQPRRRLNTDRAKDEFGFEASVNFQDGIRTTVDWYIKSHKVAAGT